MIQKHNFFIMTSSRRKVDVMNSRKRMYSWKCKPFNGKMAKHSKRFDENSIRVKANYGTIKKSCVYGMCCCMSSNRTKGYTYVTMFK